MNNRSALALVMAWHWAHRPIHVLMTDYWLIWTSSGLNELMLQIPQLYTPTNLKKTGYICNPPCLLMQEPLSIHFIQMVCAVFQNCTFVAHLFASWGIHVFEWHCPVFFLWGNPPVNKNIWLPSFQLAQGSSAYNSHQYGSVISAASCIIWLPQQFPVTLENFQTISFVSSSKHQLNPYL